MVKIPSINAPRTDVSLLRQTMVNMLKVLLTIEKTFMRLKNQEHDRQNKYVHLIKPKLLSMLFLVFVFTFINFATSNQKYKKVFSIHPFDF